MAKAHIHATASARRYGGILDDYLDIHVLMDSSKVAVADNRHRVLTHHMWFVGEILPKIFGEVRKNSDGRNYSIRQIGEDHCLEDFRHKFIPTAQDYIESIDYLDWMQNGNGLPPSARKVGEARERRRLDSD